VPLLELPAKLPRTSVRTVAFYLPQFHPIPENDLWWGRGFTEWTNVARARPLFAGHYQPRLPGELGFYDLRVIENQRRQVELARLYGVDAFCFYAYWFGGRRLLEAPLHQYASQPELDLPFFICWANQNWTRRWDGSDSTVLLAQSHSPEDDIAFIEHFSRYLLDPLYLRIGDRPLLLVYRPEHLPDPHATSERWRTWLHEVHGTELFLAYVQGVDDVDPDVFGFDGAVEFPPLRPRGRPLPREITAELNSVSPDVRARVYDWRDLAADSLNYAAPGYRLFRGVCPSWDNTARRGTSASILWYSSPVEFQNWLLRALEETEERLPEDERLVFVNAWNEWAEGCHLEPDRRFGYAYLEAVRVASVRAGARRVDPARKPRLGITLHVSSPELLTEIEGRLVAPGVPLVVTAASEHVPAVAALFEGKTNSVEVVQAESRGRDPWLFLQVLPRLESVGCDVVLRLHTDASSYPEDGGAWREVLDALLDEETVSRTLRAFAEDPSLGMVGPAGDRRTTTAELGGDGKRLTAVAHRIGIETLRPDHSFFAGAMFFARLDALASLRAIQLDRSDLQPDAGHGDATLDETLERCFPLSVEAADFRVADTSALRRRIGPLRTG
jgi:lipopolysaccharide biosynthesis protein